MGRPTKYSQEMIDKAREYLVKHKEYGDLVPSAVGLACALDVSRRVLYKWAEENEQFMHILDEVQTAQEKQLLSGGLGGEFNSAIVKLMLGKHGYSDKQETAVSGAININVAADGFGKL